MTPTTITTVVTLGSYAAAGHSGNPLMTGHLSPRYACRMERFNGKYLSVTSFKRDGTGVATPMWFVADDGHLLVETDADSYKVKRIRRDPHVRIALCDARGRLRGEPLDAEAEILPESERGRVERLLGRKYRIDRFTVLPLYRLVMRLRRRGPRTDEHPVAVVITLE